ncbi:MAG: exodeoxyribonuclease VII small subunit [Anaerolineales bacterium]|nr:exodeoxyribonuclease VII small subunit [Anaerolineales bacterium]
MPKAKPTKQPNFEQAFDELGSVVTRLETGELPLEEALALFERGQELAAVCAHLLDKAELRLKTLARDDLKAIEEDDLEDL